MTHLDVQRRIASRSTTLRIVEPADVPAHLRQFVVRQNYDEYTEEDHAVWRFVVQQAHDRLCEVAHPAYESGFSAAGITVDRIPHIDEMSRRLERFGFRAVCVDGFIPPRAFQAFQALGVLPIAADIRTSRHLAYTPAPDIIHEAAGHAPFLAEPHYARYVRRIGAVAEKAFSSRADRQVYEAIYTLSEVKENPASTAHEIELAEQSLVRAKEDVGPPSEAAIVARLFWWTAEYGLVGTPRDYRLYGAGLLSSLGEGHFCHGPDVRKIPLSADCVDVDYDVTRAQPQLFVAKSFAELEDVLDRVESKLAFRIGGEYSLEKARESREVATLELDSAVEVVGIVSKVNRTAEGPSLIELSGPVAIASEGSLLEDLPRCSTYALPLGVLEDGTPLSELSPDALARRIDHGTTPGRLVLRLKGGMVVSGLVRALVPKDGRVVAALLDAFEITNNGESLYFHESAYPLALGRSVRTAAAGAPFGYFPATEPSKVTVPKPRTFSARDRELIGLFEQAMVARQTLTGADAAREAERIVGVLDERHSDAWLLRWNLLEILTTLGVRSDLTAKLQADLEALELQFDHLEPIATGLAYLEALRSGGKAQRARAG
jgi:phenylalanine-4-hydroxylase